MNDYFVYSDQFSDSQNPGYGYAPKSFYVGHEHLRDEVHLLKDHLTEARARQICEELNSRNSPETD